MKIRFHLTQAIGLAILFYLTGSSLLHSQGADSAALSGKVSSQEEGLMEGVLVTARKAGSTFSVTVVSNQGGQYSFPRTHLQPGQYSLRIRAIGYDLDGPQAVEVEPQKTAVADLKLRKTQDLASQLTTAEWLASFPGTHEQKISLLTCSSCHTLQQVAKSTHNADEWIDVFKRMSGFEPESSMARAQKVPPSFVLTESAKKQAAYLTTVNLSSGQTWPFSLKTLARPKGRATRVIITEYDLPKRDGLPHDVAADANGIVWYSDSGWQYLGKFDPRTNKFTEYPIPVFSPDETLGTLDVRFDKRGGVWVGLMHQGGKVAKFDPQTETFRYWDLLKKGDSPESNFAFVEPLHDDLDGKVWVDDVWSRLCRLDINSGHVDTYKVFEKMQGDSHHMIYQVLADSRNNGYFLEWIGGGVGRVDAKTGEVAFYQTPTRNSFSRRGNFDSQDRLWFGEFFGNQIGMFDAKTNQFTEREVPTAWFAPYDAAPDKNGEIWASSLSADRLDRFDPKAGQTTEYLLPRYTDARRVSFDYSAGKLVIWLPNKNSASILKVEPLD